jgi:hypothetical protein
MTRFYQRFLKARRHLRLRLLVTGLGGTLLLFGLGLGALALLNNFAPVQEGTALSLFVAWAVLSAVIGVFAMIAAWRHEAALGRMAGRVEGLHPEFMSALDCAVELSGRGAREPNPIEAALLRQVERQTATLPLESEALPPLLRGARPFGLLVLGVVLAAACLFTPVARKAQFHLADSLRGEFTGMAIEPGNAEHARGRDLVVSAEALRWETAVEIEFTEGGGRAHRYPLIVGREGRPEFRLFEVADDLRYRFHTASLTSPWFTLEIYDPPRLDELHIEAIPPAYSRLPRVTLYRVEDFEVLEGTRVEVRLASRFAGEAFLRIDETDTALRDVGNGHFSGSLTLDRSVRYSLVLRSGERETRTARRAINVFPDEPPVIEITAPGRDLTLEPGSTVPLEIYTADDFGVAAVDLTTTIAGREPVDRRLFRSGEVPRREETVFNRIDLDGIGAGDGDIVIYFATVRDNREPRPQAVRSEVFFIEVREEVEPEEMDGMDGEDQEQIDLRALIVEIKRLIRDTYGALSLEEREQLLANQEIATGLANVRNEVRFLLRELGTLDMSDEEREFVLGSLERTIHQLQEAISALNNNRTPDALPPEIEALRELVALENALRDNTVSRESQGEGSGEGAESESTEPGEESGQGEGPPPLPSIADLADALSDLNSLIDDQSALNRRMGRAERTNAPPPETAALGDNQSGLADRNREIAGRIARMPAAAPLTQLLGQADAHMGRAESALQAHEAGTGERHGIRAGESLVRAAGLLEGLINEIAGGMISSLSQSAEALSREQGAAAGESGAAGRGERPGDGLEDNQRGLGERFNEFQDGMGRVAAELRDLFPESASALDQVARQLEAAQTASTMTRAENALLYERFDRAEQFQERAAGDLAAAASGIQSAGEGLPTMGEAALREALARLSQARDELDALAQGDTGTGESPGQNGQESGAPGEGSEGGEGMPGEGEGEGIAQAGQPGSGSASDQLGSLRQEMANMLREISGRLDDNQLRNLAEALGGGIAADDLVASVRETDGTLTEASRALLRYLQTEGRSRQLDQIRRGAPPPGRYQRQIEAYFRSLAEGQ